MRNTRSLLIPSHAGASKDTWCNLRQGNRNRGVTSGASGLLSERMFLMIVHQSPEWIRKVDSNAEVAPGLLHAVHTQPQLSRVTPTSRKGKNGKKLKKMNKKDGMHILNRFPYKASTASRVLPTTITIIRPDSWLHPHPLRSQGTGGASCQQQG